MTHLQVGENGSNDRRKPTASSGLNFSGGAKFCIVTNQVAVGYQATLACFIISRKPLLLKCINVFPDVYDDIGNTNYLIGNTLFLS